MTAFALLRCMVAIAGDRDHVIYRSRNKPIVYPELPILQFLHGDDAITDIAVVGTWDTTNDAVLGRLHQIYDGEVIRQVFPGVKPKLQPSDPAIPRCTRPVYKPRPTKPETPDPILTPLDQFTTGDDLPEGPELPPEDVPTPEQIAAHAQDDDDDDGLGFDPVPADPAGAPVPDLATVVAQSQHVQETMPRVEDQERIVRDLHGRMSSQKAPAARLPSHLPDVNAGGSHPPGYTQKRMGNRR